MAHDGQHESAMRVLSSHDGIHYGWLPYMGPLVSGTRLDTLPRIELHVCVHCLCVYMKRAEVAAWKRAGA
jgi:hypothetical protein